MDAELTGRGSMTETRAVRGDRGRILYGVVLGLAFLLLFSASISAPQKPSMAGRGVLAEDAGRWTGRYAGLVLPPRLPIVSGASIGASVDLTEADYRAQVVESGELLRPTRADTLERDVEADIVILELLPAPGSGGYEWVELGYAREYSYVYLPLVVRHRLGGAAAVHAPVQVAATTSGLPDISGYQITDLDGNLYTIPDALPEIPLGGRVIIYFDGQGSAVDDYDFDDGVSRLHSPPGVVNLLEDAGDQVALYTGSVHGADTLSDFVAYDESPGSDAADAVAAGRWQPGWRVDTQSGTGARIKGAPAVTGLSIGLLPRHQNRSPDDWAVYQGNDRTPGAANAIPRAYWSTMPDGATVGSDGLALGWMLVLGATYRFQMSDEPAFASPLVDLILDDPYYAPTDPVPAGTYYWRVQTISAQNQASAWSSPRSVQVIAIGGAHAVRDTSVAQSVVRQQGVPMTWHRQQKDTRLLCLDGCREGNPDDTAPEGAWDSVHPDGHFAHGRQNCFRASVAMVASRYGGTLSQDYLSYILFENWGNPIQSEDEDEEGEPSGDLGHNTFTWAGGRTGTAGGELLAWALRLDKDQITYRNSSKPSFDQIVLWIDAGRPVLIVKPNGGPGGAHAVVIRSYRILERGHKQVEVFDPWAGIEKLDYRDLDVLCYYVPPAEAPNVRSDPSSIWTDSDGDGIYDFDEQNRFPTFPSVRDSDGDGVNDKQDMRETLFTVLGNYRGRRFPNIDRDDLLRKEIDPDNDNGGAKDGCEDSNGNGRRDDGETSNFDPRDDVPCHTPTVQFDSANYSGSEGTGTTTVVVTLSATAATRVTVDYATSDGTARAGSDYVSASGTLTFAPGETRRTFTVSILDDSLDEPDETLSLLLSNPSQAVLGTPRTAVLTIADDDVAPTPTRTNTPTPTRTSTPTPTPTPTNVAQVTLDRAYTTDYWGNRQTAFRPGEAILLMLDATNHSNRALNVTYEWDVHDPTGAQDAYFTESEGPVPVPVGQDTRRLTKGVLANARRGSYTFRGIATTGSGTSSSSTTFDVQGSPIGINLLETTTCKDIQDSLPVQRTSSFTTDDSRVYAWTAWEGAAGPHSIRWEWYRPDGGLHDTIVDDFDFYPYSVAYLWAWESIEYMAAYPGQWEIRFYMDGSRAGTIQFTLTGEGPGDIYLDDATTCRGIQDNMPVGRTDTFTTSDNQVYAWTAWGDSYGSHRITWRWYRPDGSLYGTLNYDFQSTTPYYYCWSFDSVSALGNNFGRWRIDYYMDGSYVDRLYFTLQQGGQSSGIDLSEPSALSAAGAAASPTAEERSAPMPWRDVIKVGTGAR